MMSQILIRFGLFVTGWESRKISVWLFLLVDIHTVGQSGIVTKCIQKELQSNQGPLERTTFDRFPVAGTGLVLSSLLHLGVPSPFGRRSRNAALRLSDARRQPNC